MDDVLVAIVSGHRYHSNDNLHVYLHCIFLAGFKSYLEYPQQIDLPFYGGDWISFQ